jgi:hypothetical protein
MANTEQGIQDLLDRVAALHGTVVRERLAADIAERPALADALVKQLNELLEAVISADNSATPPPDKGLAQLVGIGPDAATALGATRVPHGVAAYDETVASERLIAVADLYYIYQHERIGVFRAIQKLQELFRAGTVMLSSGTGAYGLYQFDRREVLRYTRLRQHGGTGRVAAKHRLPPSADPVHQRGRAVLAGQADLGRDARARV